MGLFMGNASAKVSGNHRELIYIKIDWLSQGSFNNAVSSGKVDW
jgi:hypothetical protein